MMLKYLIFFAATIAVLYAYDTSVCPEYQFQIVDLNNLKEKMNELSTKLEVFAKLYCEKNGGTDAYVKLRNAYTDLQKCNNPLLNEIFAEAGKEDSTGDTVLQSACDRKAYFENCAKNFNEIVKVCLSKEEQDQMVILNNFINRLADFICKDGKEQFASFIAENGNQCFIDKMGDIQQCNKDFPIDVQKFKFDEQHCKQLSNIRSCGVNVLKSCSQQSPAKLVDSLFKIFTKTTPCKNYEVNGATTIFVTTATIFTALTTTLLV